MPYANDAPKVQQGQILIREVIFSNTFLAETEE